MASPAFAATTIMGGTVINQTWNAAGSPYIVQGDITVPSGAFLTIEAGTEIQFASTDGQAAGTDINRIELTVKGSLNINGMANMPVIFKAQNGSAPNTWYGIIIDTSAIAASFSHAQIHHAVRGLNSKAANNILQMSDTAISTSGAGLYLENGTSTLTNLTISNCSSGIVGLGNASPSITGSTIHSNTSYGIDYEPSSGNPTLNLTNTVIRSSGSYGLFIYANGGAAGNASIVGSTLHQNGSYGIYVEAASGSSSAVTVKNTNVTNHTSTGIYRYSFGGSTSVSVSFSNVWNNNSNYGNIVPDTNVISANPIYVNAPANLRLTANSPSRFSGDIGNDIGALPYTNDPTPGMYGTLWSNVTLNAAGSPYNIPGDLTVAPGVTLTIDPGVTLNFASTDIMAAYQDTSRAELNVAGTLNANGTAMQKITFTSAGNGPNSFYGITFMPSANGGTLAHATVEEAVRALQYLTPAGNTNTIKNTTLSTSGTGLYQRDGNLTLNEMSMTGNSTGMVMTDKASATLNRTLIANNTSFGIDAEPSSGTQSLNLVNTIVRNSGSYGIFMYANAGATMNGSVVNSTFYQNGSYGMYIEAASGSAANLDIKNSIVTNHTSTGIYRYSFGGSTSVNVTYSDVWMNNSNYGNVVAGAGCISQNPLYVSPPNDLKLQMGSVCIDAGSNMGAPNSDFAGVLRPLNGDGINGSEYDIGAYEYAPAAFCGDGVVTAGEVCDSGAQNGMYGFCKADCSGLGPRCGDNMVNGPETCDDGNMVNTDACLNTCVLAACGDGIVQSGVEECDDGNQNDGDACVPGCKNAKCGDGFVRAGTEECDDGNMSNTDACLSTCQTATCGDMFVQMGAEQCDDGNMSNTDSCVAGCGIAACGDGYVYAGVETCDDGNTIDGDGCPGNCGSSCGDGTVQGMEECDDANMSNTDACVVGCKNATCGDGFVYAGMETCDDSNTQSGDGCSATCSTEGMAPVCGNNTVESGEQCDDGNTMNGDGCSSQCQNEGAAMCGDGVKQAGEACDDGNASNTDGCLNGCLLPSCGDSFVQVGTEECDDGNGATGDGCKPDCTLESTGGGGKSDPGDEGGCGCRAVGSQSDKNGMPLGLGLLALGAAALLRRRGQS